MILPKSVRVVLPPVAPGPEVTTSAEDRARPDSALVTVLVQLCVASESTRVYVSAPLKVTDAVSTSPGFTGLLKSTGSAGYISYQPKVEAVPAVQSVSVPICSTESLLTPSSPTQKATS